MNSLDELRRAEANPFLYGKIQSRMRIVKESVPKQLAWRMVIALLIVAAMNVATILHSNTKQKENGAELVAKEYSMSSSQEY